MWRLAESWIAARRHRGQKGQTLIIVAFLSVFLITLLGLVVDSVRLYVLSAQAERAAEAAALAGALYMPTYFDASNPAPDGHYAQERACAVLLQNGVTSCPVSAGQVGGRVSTVPTNQYEVEVTVTLQADVFFLAFVSPGLSTATISRSALAEFLPTIQLGSRASYFGDEADIDPVTSKPVQSFWASINGPLNLKEQGDAYTPTLEEGPTDPQKYPDSGSRNYSRWGGTVCCTNHQQYGTCAGCPAGPQPNPDVHQAGLAGYNYQIVVPANSGDLQVQIYNPAFVHGDAATGDTVTIDATKDPAFGGKTDQKNEYMQMTYMLYSVPVLFERSQDTLLTSFQPPSLDRSDSSAHCGGSAPPPYWDPQQQLCVADPGYIDQWYTLYIIPNSTKPATYRLSVNATGYYGSKNYGLKLTPKGSAPTSTAAPAGVRIFAWNEMCVIFNLSGGSGDSFFDIGEIPADYAGKTLHFKLFDPGETSGSGNLDMFIHDPSGAAVQLPNWLRTVSSRTDLQTSISGDRIYNGLWLDMPIGIPPTYNPAPGSDWWQVEYKATGGGTPNDKITISIGLSGSPVHLVNEIV